jgi:hypothetical protein
MYEHDEGVSQLVNWLATVLIITILIFSFSGCEVVEFIFKTGVVVGILLIVGIILLVSFIMGKISRRS